MSYQALLFDMDGVIVDTHQSVTAFWQDQAARYLVHISQSDFSQHVYGCPAAHTLDVLFSHLTAGQRQSVFEELAVYEANLKYTGVKGAIAFLHSLKQGGIPTALVTSGDLAKAEQVLDQLDLDGLFTARVTVEDIRNGKPDPECYLLAARFLDKSPERCIVFEDSLSGVRAAVASGALCFGIGSSSMSPLLRGAGARYVVPDFTSIRLVTDGDYEAPAPVLPIGAGHSLGLIEPRGME